MFLFKNESLNDIKPVENTRKQYPCNIAMEAFLIKFPQDNKNQPDAFVCDDASIPYGHRFKSQLFYFQSSALLMCLAKDSQVGICHSHGRSGRSFWHPASALPSPGHCGHLENKPIDENLTFALCLFFSLLLPTALLSTPSLQPLK